MNILSYARRGLVALALAGGLSLGACSTTGGLSPDPATIKQIQDIAVSVCGFLPTVTTVTGIIGAAAGVGPIVATVNGIATAICSAVTSKTAAPGTAPTAYGVPIHGRFVGKPG